MKIIPKEDTLLGIKIAEKNTFKNRLNHGVVPNVERKDTEVVFKIEGKTVSVNSYDEITLYILAYFEFIPLWLVEYWYKDEINLEIGSGLSTGKQHIKDWSDVGIVYLENDPRGLHLRPTKALFNLFDILMPLHKPIPEALYNHTVGEMSVAHDLMNGDSPILDKIINPPRISHLGFEPNNEGTTVVFEREFRYPGLHTKQGIGPFMKVEEEIKQQMKLHERITRELSEPIYFGILNKHGNTGIQKEDYSLHIPDMIVPMLRDNEGNPQSTAIEVELSVKSTEDYQESFRRFRDNTKYGTVIWLTIGSGSAEVLKHAFQKVGGTGSTKIILMDYDLPERPYDKF